MQVRPKSILKVASFASFLLILVSGGKSFAATVTWDKGGGDNNWTTALNWSGDALPLITDTVAFPMGSVVVLDADETVAGIACTAVQLPSTTGNTVGLGGTQNLIINGNIDVASGVDCTFAPTTVTIAASTVNVTLANDPSTHIAFGTPSGSIVLGANTLTTSSTIATSPSTDNISGLPLLTLSGTITGTSAAHINNTKARLFTTSDVDTTSFLGSVSLTDAVLHTDSAVPAFSAATLVTLLRSQIYFSKSPAAATFTYPTPLYITGNLFGATGSQIGFAYTALDVNSEFADSGGTPAATFSGAITLGSDVAVHGTNGSTTPLSIKFTGAITGAHTLAWSGVVVNDTSRFILASSANGSKVPNGTYKPISGTSLHVSDSVPTEDIMVIIADYYVNGTRGNILVSDGGTFGGTGTVKTVTVLAGGTVSPGNSPGCLNTGNLTFNAGTTYLVQLDGNTVCTEYDKTNVTGTVSLGGTTLSLSKLAGFKPASGKVFTIIDNDGADAVTGTFAGMVEGATITNDSVNYKVSYKGGTGNDVTLTVLSGTPNTGAKILGVGSIYLGIAAVFMAVTSSLYLSRRRVTVKNK